MPATRWTSSSARTRTAPRSNASPTLRGTRDALRILLDGLLRCGTVLLRRRRLAPAPWGPLRAAAAAGGAGVRGSVRACYDLARRVGLQCPPSAASRPASCSASETACVPKTLSGCLSLRFVERFGRSCEPGEDCSPQDPVYRADCAQSAPGQECATRRRWSPGRGILARTRGRGGADGEHDGRPAALHSGTRCWRLRTSRCASTPRSTPLSSRRTAWWLRCCRRDHAVRRHHDQAFSVRHTKPTARCSSRTRCRTHCSAPSTPTRRASHGRRRGTCRTKPRWRTRRGCGSAWIASSRCPRSDTALTQQTQPRDGCRW